MKKECILKVENISKEYRLGSFDAKSFRRDLLKLRSHQMDNSERIRALDGVSFSVEKGEAIGIIGANGAGKSTLLKIISQITAPSEGKIYLDGKVSSMLEVGTGFHPEMTGRENIYLNGSILGMSKKEIDSKMESIIAFSECERFIDTPVKRYSSGMYVKLAFAVASHLESDILIMDEVLAVGDVKFQQKCLNRMKEIAETEDRTILYVSHNMNTIRKLCKRCIVLQSGKIVLDGSAEEAIDLYLGSHLRESAFIDFNKYPRPEWLGRDEVRLTWVEYPSGNCKADEYGKLNLFFKWECKTEVEHLGLRIEVLDGEEMPFATAVCYDFFSGVSGEEGEATLQMSLPNVMSGTYKTIYTLFCMAGYGDSIDIDSVKGLDIIVEKKQGDDELHWRNKPWGNVQLPQIKVLDNQ